jgi:hypothetical protein
MRFTFGVGAACVGAAGALMITIIPVSPVPRRRIHAARLRHRDRGGLGSMTGRAAGRLLIGVSEAVAGLLLQPSLKSMFSFGCLDPGPAAAPAGPVRQAAPHSEFCPPSRRRNAPPRILWSPRHPARTACSWRRRCSQVLAEAS